MIISLIGYRASGKSSVATELARLLGFRAVDSDREIEVRAGQTIRQIFASEGEAGFRGWERLVLSEWLRGNHGDRIVLATGGGAILNDLNRSEMRVAGPIIWLQASPSAIAERMMSDPQTASSRPALTSAGCLDEVDTVLAVREPLYSEIATISINTDERTIPEICDEIMRQLPSMIEEDAT